MRQNSHANKDHDHPYTNEHLNSPEHSDDHSNDHSDDDSEHTDDHSDDHSVHIDDHSEHTDDHLDHTDHHILVKVEYEVDEDGHPSRADCESISWPNYHFSTALSKSVGRLYDNYEGILDKFAQFWGTVATRFAESDFILGYEIMNEPWCGDVYEDPTLLIPGVADRRNLQPVNDRVNEEIRKYDTEHLVFFEAVTWEIVGIGEALGFTHPPGGDDFKNRSVLSLHNSVKSDVTPDEDFYEFKLGEIQRLGIAGFVTETNNNGHDVMGLLDDINKYGWSWQHWAYKRYVLWLG